jgi:hypothetical protein
MRINLKKVLPSDLSSFAGYREVRIATAFYLLVIIARSSIHLFASDGGANSIAGIDISVAGGDNIVAIFHQWGATQLLLALFLSLLFIRYPGMTPLIVLTLALEPVMRLIAGQIKSVTADGPPPGESLNGPSLVFLAVLFIASVLEKRTPKNQSN